MLDDPNWYAPPKPARAHKSNHYAEFATVSERLDAVTEEIADVLARAGRIPPKIIGLANARHVISTCLRWQNERPRALVRGLPPKSPEDLTVGFAKLNVIAVGDDPDWDCGALHITTVSNSETGPFLGFACGFELPTYTELALVLGDIQWSSRDVICLDDMMGAVT